MRRIKSFIDFNVNEAKLYYLSQFKSALDSAPSEFSEIVKDLRKLWGKETGVDITLIDIEDNMLSYSSERGIEDFLNDATPDDINDFERNVSLSTRSNVKVGRFLNKVINTPKKYPESLIDRFVTYLRSKSKKKETYDIRLVKGDEIAKYYNSSNYAQMRGSLGNSCMTDKKDGRADVTVNTQWGTSTTYGTKATNKNIFDIYTKNPEVCSLLIMTNGEGKLVARGIVWDVKINTAYDHKGNIVELNNIKFLDRVYTTEDWMVHKMCNWAEENGMAYRYYQNFTNGDKIIYKNDVYYVDMEVSVKKIHYAGFPFLDTFTYYDVKGGRLLNYKDKKFSGFGLQSTHGNYGVSTGAMPRIRNYIRRFSN
jgi:hypothetical protein